ncbi:ribonuclease H-like domain-containing protein [Tanacetum coccineum]
MDTTLSTPRFSFYNESAICIVKNLVFHSKTKHIEIRHHFTIDSNEKKLIQMIQIHTDQNVADLLTKAFNVGRFQYLIASPKVLEGVTSVKLIGTKTYRVWAVAMKLAINTRNKIGFIDGTRLKSAYEFSASLTNQWERCNSIILSWLLNSVSEDLFLEQLFSDNVVEFWAELKETYDKLDGSVILNLLQKIHNFKQGELTVFEYYHRLNSLWIEFDIMIKLPKFSYATRDDMLKHNQLIKLMQFLMGLNDVYQPIRSSLLSRETLPDVKDAFAIISREESHIGIASSSGFDSNKIVGTSSESGGLYMFDQTPSQTIGKNTDISVYVSKTLWHSRLGHPADQAIGVLQKELQMSKDSHVSSSDICHGAKQTRDLFPFSDHKTSAIGDLIQLDLWGPYKVTSREGFRYFLTVVGDYFRVVWPYLLKTKDKVYNMLTSFYNLLFTQLPSSVLSGKSPFEMIYGIQPKLSHIRSFGCLCYSTVLNNTDKFSSKSVKCVLIGFSIVKKAYKLYSLDDKIVIYSRDVRFYENVFPLKMNTKLTCDTVPELSKQDLLNQLNFFDTFHDQTPKSPYDEERATPYDDVRYILYLLVPTGRYVVSTGRVIATVSIKVPTGKYIVPAGYIISPGRVT